MDGDSDLVALADTDDAQAEFDAGSSGGEDGLSLEQLPAIDGSARPAVGLTGREIEGRDAGSGGKPVLGNRVITSLSSEHGSLELHDVLVAPGVKRGERDGCAFLGVSPANFLTDLPWGQQYC
jgi:hypothetical protein